MNGTQTKNTQKRKNQTETRTKGEAAPGGKDKADCGGCAGKNKRR